MFSVPRVVAVLAFLVGFSVPAQADPVLECSRTHSNQVAIGTCLVETGKDVDSAMAAALGFAMSAAQDLDGVTGRKVTVPALNKAQAAWSDYREKHCAYVGATYGGGSGTGTAILACRINLTRARTRQLMRFAK